MNDTAKAVLWIGMFLIAMIVVVHWSAFKTMLFSGEKGGVSTGQPGSGSSGHIIVPPGILPFPFPLPIPHIHLARNTPSSVQTA